MDFLTISNNDFYHEPQIFYQNNRIIFNVLKFNFSNLSRTNSREYSFQFEVVCSERCSNASFGQPPRLYVEIPDRNRVGTQTFVSTAINNERMVFYVGAFLFTYYDFYCLLKWKFGAYWAEIFHINQWNQDGENVNFVFQTFDNTKENGMEKYERKPKQMSFYCGNAGRWRKKWGEEK